jgi:hypothetical protein
VKPLSFSNDWIAGMTVLLCVSFGSASADVGGGKGSPSTPWRVSGPKTVQELEEAKANAAKCQTISIPGELLSANKISGVVHLRCVSLRTEDPREGDAVGYALLGKSDSGETVSVSFSEIESFIVTSKTDSQIVMSVTIWPNISPQQLIQKQPNYKELVENYRHVVTLKMSLKSRDGRGFIFAEEGKFGKTVGTILPLEKLGVQTKVDFYGDPSADYNMRFWWAIPSVAQDPAYPYRVFFKK